MNELMTRFTRWFDQVLEFKHPFRIAAALGCVTAAFSGGLDIVRDVHEESAVVVALGAGIGIFVVLGPMLWLLGVVERGYYRGERGVRARQRAAELDRRAANASRWEVAGRVSGSALVAGMLFAGAMYFFSNESAAKALVAGVFFGLFFGALGAWGFWRARHFTEKGGDKARG